MSVFEAFKKTKPYLICVDSDGCAMNTMDIKHIRCFGPCMIAEWKLEAWGSAILKRWNEINLYTMTRGINRFAGLACMLSEIQEDICVVEGSLELAQWVKISGTLSEEALEQVIVQGGHPIFQKALSWSKAVNLAIEKLPEEELVPFRGVREALQFAHGFADIAIVSSANAEAVWEEWTRCNLMESVDICLTQQVGSKRYCIEQMCRKGYDTGHVLMVGDAPGDQQAAEANGVFFYPIRVKHEAESWSEFVSGALPRFFEEQYEGAYQKRMRQEFEQNLTVQE